MRNILVTIAGGIILMNEGRRVSHAHACEAMAPQRTEYENHVTIRNLPGTCALPKKGIFSAIKMYREPKGASGPLAKKRDTRAMTTNFTINLFRFISVVRNAKIGNMNLRGTYAAGGRKGWEV